VSADLEVSGVSHRVALEIREVYEATGGEDLAVGVLTRAADPDSALHRHFEWDDTKAAAAHRLKQADDLIRRVRVTIIPADDSPPVAVRAYVSGKRLSEAGMDLGVDGGVRQYLSIETVAGRADHEVLLLASLRRDIRALKAKYRHVEKFGEIFREMMDDDEVIVAS